MKSPENDLNRALAATLNGERVRAGLTFDQLAEESGISKRTLMRLLSTVERDIDVRVLTTLAEVFHTVPSAILADAEAWMHRDDPVTDQPPQDRRRGQSA